MSDKPLSQSQLFLLKAAEDEQALHISALASSILGFHAQQAVEKLLKALLTQLNVPFERTHDLGRLHLVLQAAGEKLPPMPLSLGNLSDYAVIYRYDLIFRKRGWMRQTCWKRSTYCGSM